jgi:aminoglycoside phosphotransferase (APT) family kinase protein
MQELEARLAAVIRRELGPHAMVTNLHRMASGHAGFTYGFTTQRAEADAEDRFVLKMGPRGVRRSGAGDVFRQAALLRSLATADVPVPTVVWADSGEEALGAPYIIMQWMPGQECFPLDPPETFRSDVASRFVWREAIAALRRLGTVHNVDLPPEWLPPVPLIAELLRWEPTLRKAPDSEWVSLGLAARDALLDHLPQSELAGLVHGDFQPANLLFFGNRVSAIIDWDLAFVGDPLIDLGWLMMFADPQYWGPQWTPIARPSPESLAADYAAPSTRSAVDTTWYHAFAGYRFGAIACLNVRLHRTGRRPDLIWERFALDIPRLFIRSRALALRCPTLA